MAWPHQKQTEYHKLIACDVSCVIYMYIPEHENVRGCGGVAAISPNLGRVQLKCDGTRWRTGGEVKGNWQMEWAASTIHTTSEHGASSITTADAHISAASSRLNWRPPPILDSSVSPRDEIWFLRLCHHISYVVCQWSLGSWEQSSILGIEGWVDVALWKEKCARSQESIVGCWTYSLIYTETSKQERQFLCLLIKIGRHHC
jgi:hypothetical protein